MKNIKQILIFVTILVLFVGVVSANDEIDNTTDTSEVTEKALHETNSISYDTGSTDTLRTKEVVSDTNIVTDDIQEKRIKDEIVKNEKRNTKTAGQHTYYISDSESLHNALLSNDYEDVTININSDITLKNSNVLNNSTIRHLIINGNNKIINGQNKYQFLWLLNESTVIINNLTLTHCYSGVHGGVIDTYKANVTLNNCKLTDNSAPFGGAIDNQNNCIVILNNCLLSGNRQTQGTISELGGGAIMNEDSTTIINNCIIKDNDGKKGGAIFNGGTLKITNTIISNNKASDPGWGGTIYTHQGSVSITNSIINSSEGVRGGAIYTCYTNMALNNVTFNNNRAKEGGAIYARYEGTININNCEFNDNTASEKGGAMYGPHTLNINNTRFNNNNCMKSGGAIYNNDGKLTVDNSTFNNNKAKGVDNDGGGAINNHLGTANIYNSEFYNNEGYDGGAIFSNDTLNITNSRFNDNKASYGGAIFAVGSSLDLYKSILKNNTATEKLSSNGAGGAVFGMSSKTKILNNEFISNNANGPGNVIYAPLFSKRNNNTNDGSSKYGCAIYLLSPSEIRNNIFYEKSIKTNIILTTNNSNPAINEKINISVKLSDQFNFVIPEQEVNIFINNQKYEQRTNNAGIVSIEYIPTNSNPLKIDAKYDDDSEYYVSSSATLNIKVKKASQLYAEDISSVVGQEFTINGTLLDENSNPFIHENIYLNLDNHIYLLTTNEYGQFNTTLTFLKSGKYDMEIVFNGNNDYAKSTKTQTLTIIPQASIDIGILNHTESNLELEITVTDETGAVIPEQNVIITLPDGTCITQKTESEGKIRITDTTATVGEKTVTATIESTGELIGTTQNKNIFVVPDYQKTIDNLTNIIKEQNKVIDVQNNTINEQNNIINQLNNTVQKQNKTINEQNKTIENLTKQNKVLNNTIKSLTTKLKDANNKIIQLKNTTTELKNQLNQANNKIRDLNNQISNLTRELDYANSRIADLNNQINNLTIQLKEKEKKINELNEIIDKLLNKKPFKTTITVNPIKSSIGSITNITANIVCENGDKVTGGQAVFKVNGITLKDENNNIIYAQVKNGTARINYKVQEVWIKDTSYVEAVYSGTANYTGARTKATDILKISKGKATISLDKQTITAKTGQTITLRAKIRDVTGDNINKGKVVFKLNGKTLKDENGEVIYVNVKDGEAILNYTIPNIYRANTYILTAVYGGNNYQRAETNGTLIIQKHTVTINTATITTKNGKTRIKAKIRDETGKLLVTNTKLAIKINQKTILNNVTSTNGVIDVSFITTLRPGIYELMIISGENSIYNKATLNTVLKISK